MTHAAHKRRWRIPMQARDPHEAHRVATPLELLFDLCFVVAVAFAAARLHHAIAENHVGQGLIGFAMTFFAIWWAWMNFTWFASAYDTDDAPYRATALLQITGVLVLAAGVPAAFDEHDFRIPTLGYAIMRVGLVIQWLRASRASPATRVTALRYAGGVALMVPAWCLMLVVPENVGMILWPILVIGELSVPIWAERAGKTPWHPHHISERYGCFTLIVLGESILSSTNAVQEALAGGHADAQLVGIMVGGLATVFAMWWVYFDQHTASWLTSNRVSFVWGYGHILIFGAVASIGSGLAVMVDQASGHAHLSNIAAGCAMATPVAIYLVTVWFLHIRPNRHGAGVTALFLVAAALVQLAPLTGWTAPVVGAVMVALVAGYTRLSAR